MQDRHGRLRAVLIAPALGTHTVEIRAIDAQGNTDPTPAAATWKTVAARVDLCGQITSDRTIGPDEATVYVITCAVTVSNGSRRALQSGRPGCAR